MDRLVELLKKKNTGPADCLARKLMVSRRTIFRYFDEMRLKGAVISYSKSKETYCLENKFNFTEDFLLSAMEWHSTQLPLVNNVINDQISSV
ncbi:MAG: HTH domain-containing protein [Bacteroidota bacterium]|nr:HTH domain-containing protein [Bacteroidota bacterium]